MKRYYLVKISMIVVVAVNFIFFIIMSLFSIFNTYKNAEYSYWLEKLFCIKDKPILIILGIFALIIVFLLLYGGIELINKRIREKYLIIAILLIHGLIGLYWIAVSNTVPSADQLFVFLAAEEFINGEYSMFCEGGYMMLHQHQLGLLLIHIIINLIIKTTDWIYFQGINVIASVITIYMVYKIAATLVAIAMWH